MEETETDSVKQIKIYLKDIGWSVISKKPGVPGKETRRTKERL